MMILSSHLGLSQSNSDTSYIYAPNSFTPNNDGVNDVFRITADSIYDITMIIYNRAGANVYESSTLWWNGDSGTGFYCENGVYTWLLRYKNINGFYVEKRGHILLTR